MWRKTCPNTLHFKKTRCSSRHRRRSHTNNNDHFLLLSPFSFLISQDTKHATASEDRGEASSQSHSCPFPLSPPHILALGVRVECGIRCREERKKKDRGLVLLLKAASAGTRSERPINGSSSSSVLWPFLLLPFFSSGFAHFVPLCLDEGGEKRKKRRKRGTEFRTSCYEDDYAMTTTTKKGERTKTTYAQTRGFRHSHMALRNEGTGTYKAYRKEAKVFKGHS